jgi:hypothetical protein
MRVIVIAVALILALNVLAFAGNNPDAKVVIHVKPHAKACKAGIAEECTCAELITTEPSGNIDAYPVFYNLNEYQGCEYAVCWPQWAYSAGFTNCADFVIGTVAWPGDMAAHTWTDCKVGCAVPSTIWLYADYAGYICPCEPTEPGAGLKVLDCAQGVDKPICVLCAGVYGYIGDDPCEETANEASTWGEIKDMFK